MKNLFEYTDGLNHPMEAFHHIAQADNFPILPHWHYFIEIIYLKKGFVEATCGDSVYNLQAGDLIIFCPQKVHSVNTLESHPALSGLNHTQSAQNTRLYSNNSNPRINPTHNAIYPIPANARTCKKSKESIHYDVLKFDINFLNTPNRFKTQFSKALLSVFEQNPENIFFSKDTLKDTSISTLIEQCIQEMEYGNYGSDIMAGALTASILTILMRIWIKKGINMQEVFYSSLSPNNSFDEITQYIENHYNESLQVQDLAARCNMSYSYFAKLFRQTYNQSCKEYIEFIRINKVQDFLQFTNLDLNFISQETGFSDCSHLIRTFKKYKKITPKQWRLEHIFRQNRNSHDEKLS